ncbi:hypothetical protein A2960_00995 [Candidatus Gottesmanbacteria bacterium RIFCSPLOWO2_01_FULL_39_12b]|uniref:Glycosyltransferase 2-like domain-containing protein n=1 Tax=Candidatus Gottesmanbacteria bacterium RIFCSPLOWO2_01_FULL_39_12b TaxID=1798388 RepID=A0A1F6AQH1_9BACT|nr:MAG: hypothetical protein A2960_00995 [Candidatus Gottesmanbacteria bacterium RIFCSPLOWO2_01_FULL_39_12b]
MKLSIIVPVYNEEKTISSVLEKLFKVELSCKKEIVVVNDGSTDSTYKKILNFEKRNKINVINHSKNLGKGSAINSGLKQATGNYVLIQDADLEYDPSEISKLLNPILKEQGTNKKIAVYGSRFLNNKIVMPFLYYLGNKLLTFLTNIICSTNLSDMETGYKLIPLDFFKKMNLRSSRFDIEPEITIKLINHKIPIIEIPINYKGRSRLSGKKLSMLDAYGALKALFRYRFLDRNPWSI